MHAPVSVAYAAIALAIASLFIYSATKVIYRIYFHPLRKFPGPSFAAATFWYEIYFDVFKGPGGQFIYEIDRLHAIYGPIIRINPDEIHVKDSAWADTLWAGSGHTRDRWNRLIRANGAPGSVISATSHSLHRIRRGALNPFFSKGAVTELEPSIQEKVDSLCAKIEAHVEIGRTVDLGTAFTALTLDVISMYCFDNCYNCLEQPDFAPDWKRLMTAFEGVPLSRHFPTVTNAVQSLPRSIAVKLTPGLSLFFQCQDIIATQAGEIWLAEQNSSAKNNAQEAEKASTIFHGIMRSNIPPEEKAIKRLSDEAFVLIVAGAETTARVLTVIISYLLEDQDLLNRLRRELDKVPSHALLRTTQLENIPLMRVVINEGLRIASPVTNRPTLTAPLEDLKYGEHVVPRGTAISMSFRDILYDPEIFPEPYSFRPDRWLQAEHQGQRLDRFLVTFSKGSRSCVGMNLAIAELYLGIAALVTRFDMQLEGFDRKRDLEIVRDLFVGMPTVESKGLHVKFSKRKWT